MKNKKNIILIAGFVVLVLISFYAGTAYSSSKKTTNPNSSFGQNGQFSQGKGMRAGGGNISGQIIAKDADSITVELRSPMGQNGVATTNTGTGSKIVFYTNKTTVLKTTDGVMSDLVIGKEISVQGTANTDGSVIAQSISIRPNVNTNLPKN